MAARTKYEYQASGQSNTTPPLKILAQSIAALEIGHADQPNRARRSEEV